MSSTFQFSTLLVPIDFSAASGATVDFAVSLATGEKPVLILQHVVDVHLVAHAVNHSWGSEEEVIAQMRQRAEQELETYREKAKENMDIDIIVSEGIPFLEILKKADDFAVDAVVIGKIGARADIEKLLFGATAEKVLRGARCPVIVLPVAQELQ